MVVTDLAADDWTELFRRHGDRVALVAEDGAEATYKDLLSRAAVFRDAFGQGRRLIFLEARNTLDSLAAYAACLIDAHPVYLFNAQDETVLANLSERYRPNIVARFGGDGIRMERPEPRAHALHPELRILLSTSGSTGSPKLVMLSNRNIVSNARSIADYLAIGADERAITSLKFSYSYGMSVVNSHLARGASLLLTERSILDTEFWNLFERGGATSFAGVPHSYEMLLQKDEWRARARRLRYATQAGGRLKPELVKRCAALGRADGWRFYVMYGQTEAAPRIAYLPPEHAEAHPEAIGIAIPGGRIRILDEAGGDIVEAHQPGELIYSGPNVMMGYAETPEAFAEDRSPPFLRTGDIAMWNEASLVRIIGRSARFVKPFGLRVNLDEVEALVREDCPEAACAGDDDLIVLALPGLDERATRRLADKAAERLALPAFMFRTLRPERLPRLSNGKVAYAQLLEMGKRPDVPPARDHGASRSRMEWFIARNQMTTMLVSGLWHGAAWTYILWGAIHGLYLILQRRLGRAFGPGLAAHPLLGALALPLQIAGVFVLVAASRVPFRAESVQDAGIVFATILTGPYDWAALGGKSTLAFGGGVIMLVMMAEAMIEAGVWRRRLARRRWLRVLCAIAALLLMLVLGEFAGGRFIYVQF